MLHYTQPCLLNIPELVFGPYLLQSQWRQIYKFVDFWLKFDIFSRFGEDNKRFGVMNIFGIPGKYIEKIKNITQALAISELHFHLFFYRNRCVRTSSLRGCSLRSQPLRSRVSRLRRLTSCLHKFHPNDILFTCINFAAQHASRDQNSIFLAFLDARHPKSAQNWGFRVQNGEVDVEAEPYSFRYHTYWVGTVSRRSVVSIQARYREFHRYKRAVSAILVWFEP